MKFSRLQLKDFTVFEDATFDFCPGINVLIGANGTGKSHVLKAAYGIQKTWDEAIRKHSTEPKKICPHFVGYVWPSLADVFKVAPPELMRHETALVPQAGMTIDTKAAVTAAGGVLRIVNSQDNRESSLAFPPFANEPADCLYIPAGEFLASYEGFVAAYTKRELSFDRTYFDLCVALSASNLKGEDEAWGRQFAKKLEVELPGPVTLRHGRFYIDDRQAAVVAEGDRKLAMLVQLLRNGGINSQTTLYWDEPESSLNPKMIKLVADLLLMLAENGVQIIVATHDYLLTHELSVAVEYQATKTPVRFFCLTHESPTSPINVEVGDTLTDLDHNPILEEFTAMYDREMSLFHGSQSTTVAVGGEGS